MNGVKVAFQFALLDMWSLIGKDMSLFYLKDMTLIIV